MSQVTTTYQIKVLENITKTLSDIDKSIKKTSQNIENTNKSVQKSFDNSSKAIKQSNEAAEKSVVKIEQSLFSLSSVVNKALGAIAIGFLKNRNFIEEFPKLIKKVANDIIASLKRILTVIFEIARAFLFADTAGVLKGFIKLNSEVAGSFKILQENGEEAIRVFGGDPLNFNIMTAAAKDFGAAIQSAVIDKLIDTVYQFGKGVFLGGALIDTLSGGTVALKVWDKSLEGVTWTLSTFLSKQSTAVKLIDGFGNVVSKSVGIIGSANRNLFGLIENIGTIGAGLLLLGKSLETSNSQVIRLGGTITTLLGIAATGASYLLIKAIMSLGDAIDSVAKKVIAFNIRATEAFINADRAAFVFFRTVQGFSAAFGDSIGTAESWSKTVSELEANTTFAGDAIQSTVTEIVAATSQMGFNEAQMKKLLKITADYAAFAKKDLLQTSIDFISALNGQSQSVLKFGVKLSEASVKNKLFEMGIEKSFEKMTEAEKIATRFKILMGKGYTPIMGAAEDITGTLAGQAEKLEANISTLTEAYGKGASIIENNNIILGNLSGLLANLNPTILSATGFVGGLGARIAETAAFALKWSFTVFTALKALKILDVFLKSQLSATMRDLPIPLLKKSFNDLAKSAGVATKSFTSLNGVARSLIPFLKNQLKSIVALLLSVSVSSITIKSTVVGAFKLLATWVGKVALLLKPLFSVVGGAIVFIAGAVASLVKAINEIRKRTSFFTAIWGLLTPALEKTGGIIETVNGWFKKLGAILKELFDKTIGLLVLGLSKLFSAFISLITLKPFELLFGKDKLIPIKQAQKELAALSIKLQNVNFDISKLDKNGKKKRKIAGFEDGSGDGGKDKLQKELTDEQTRAIAIANIRDGARIAEQEKELEDQEFRRNLKNQDFQDLVDGLGRDEAMKVIADEQQAIREAEKEKDQTKKTEILNKAKLKRNAAFRKADQNGIFGYQKWEEQSNRQRLQNFQETMQGLTALTASKNKTLFAIGKAAAISTATIDGIQAVQKALASAPPPFNFALAAVVGVAQAANLSKIASQKPPAFEQGGLIPSGYPNDTFPARLTSGEYVIDRGLTGKLNEFLNREQVEVKNDGSSDTNTLIVNLVNKAFEQPIIVEIDGFEIARALREQQNLGVVV